MRGEDLGLEPCGVVEVVVRRSPNPSTEAIGALTYHDYTWDMNGLEMATEEKFKPSDTLNEGM